MTQLRPALAIQPTNEKGPQTVGSRAHTGIYRYVTHDRLLVFLAHCWRPAADLGPIHGEWSTLMWWCCGDCRDGEAPVDTVK